MGTISITTPSDGQTIDASDVATPLNTIVTEINGSLDSNNIADGGVVPNNLTSGTGTSWVWQSWTPTYSGSVGDGTLVAKYIQIGKTVHLRISLTFGSTTTVSTGIFTLPVTASSEYLTTSTPIGYGIAVDNGGGQATIVPRLDSTTTLRCLVEVNGTTYSTLTSVTSAIPFTWAVNDILTISATYEAA